MTSLSLSTLHFHSDARFVIPRMRCFEWFVPGHHASVLAFGAVASYDNLKIPLSQEVV